LGSPFARSRLAAQGDAKLIEEIDRCQPLFSGHSLYCEYLRCLGALLATPEPDAPPLMSSEVWRIKSCQTVLGGWAQLRHTWALQAKQEAHWLCATRLPPGVIEPVPEFFARMARLSERARPLLRESGAFEIDTVSVAEDLRKGVIAEKKIVDDMNAEGKGLPQKGFSIEDHLLAQKVRDVMECLPAGGLTEEDYDAHTRQNVLQLAEQLDQGRIPAEPQVF
jgi:hypothetical protein